MPLSTQSPNYRAIFKISNDPGQNFRAGAFVKKIYIQEMGLDGPVLYYSKNASGVVTFLHALRCIIENRCLSIAAVRARIVNFLPPYCAHCCGTS